MIIVGAGSICRVKTLADTIRSQAEQAQPLLVESASMQITNPYHGLNEQQDYILPLQNNGMSNRAKRRKAERDAKKKKR